MYCHETATFRRAEHGVDQRCKEENVQSMDCDAQLAYSRQISGVLEIFTSKLFHTDLAFGVLSGFISRCVHARQQVSVYSGYDLCHIQTHIQADSI